MAVTCLVFLQKEYACAEGGAHLPIAHALRLPEPTKKEGKRRKKKKE